MKKFKFFRLVLVLFLIAIISLLLDLSVNLAECEYDACRYVKVTHEDLLSITDNNVYGTEVIHRIYGTPIFKNFPFFSAGIMNAIALITICLIIRNKDHMVLKLPLAIAFLIIPGKEFWLIISIMLWFPNNAKNLCSSKFQLFFTRLFSLCIIGTVRPVYIGVFFLCGVVSYFYFKKKYLYLFLILILMVISVSFFSNYFPSMSMNFAELPAASTELARILRNISIGFDVISVLFRIFIYELYFCVLPFFEIFRIFSEINTIGFMPYHVYLVAAIFVWQKMIFLKKEIYIILISYSCILASAFPFIHTRYLLPMIVFFIIYRRWYFGSYLVIATQKKYNRLSI